MFVCARPRLCSTRWLSSIRLRVFTSTWPNNSFVRALTHLCLLTFRSFALALLLKLTLVCETRDRPFHNSNSESLANIATRRAKRHPAPSDADKDNYYSSEFPTSDHLTVAGSTLTEMNGRHKYFKSTLHASPTMTRAQTYELWACLRKVTHTKRQGESMKRPPIDPFLNK